MKIMDCQQKIFTFWLMIVVVIIQFYDVLLCSTNCSAQAGVPCEVVSSSTECPKPKLVEDSNYPDQPSTIEIFPIPYGERIGMNVTWPYENNSSLTGFKLTYYTYYEFKGKFHYNDSTRSTLDQCILFNFTSKQLPSDQVTFSHNCTRFPTWIVYLAALPQQTPSKDYIHRITTGFRQDHGDKALWQPELIVIHNDSCHSRVEVELYLAPEQYNFVQYEIYLKVTKIYMDYKNQHHVITVDPKEKRTNVTFNDVPDGVYEIRVTVLPKVKGGIHSNTGAFLLQKDHPKCKERTTVPLTYDTTVPLTYDTTVPLTYDTTVPLTYDTTVPLTYDTTVPLTYDTTVPLTYDTTVPLTYDTTVPLTYDTTVPLTYDTTVPLTYDTTVPLTYDTTFPPTYDYTIVITLLASLSFISILFLVINWVVFKHIIHKRNSAHTLDTVPVRTAEIISSASEPVQPYSELNSIAISRFSNDVRKQNNRNSTNLSQIDDEKITDSGFESTENAQPKMLDDVEIYHQWSLNYNVNMVTDDPYCTSVCSGTV